MREKKLPTIAEVANYSAGAQPWSGTPTKIAPPTVYFDKGKFPADAYAAQWQNYLEHYLQRQIERSAQYPFRNWSECASNTLSNGNARWSFNRRMGVAAMVAGNTNNTIYYFQEFNENAAGAPLSLVVSPASGTFEPWDVESIDDTFATTAAYGWLVVGDNATAPTKTSWKISSAGVGTELTSPVSGIIPVICKDKTTGYFYAFAADTNRSVLVHGPDMANTWTVLGQRGAGAPAPTGAMRAAAANGLLLLAYTSGSATVERISTGAFSRTVLTPFSDTSATYDVCYSPQMAAFMALTRNGRYRFTDPASTVETTLHTPGVALGGCLHETGSATWTAQWVEVMPYYGDTPHILMFGDFAAGTVGTRMAFDGSALWFLQSKGGTKRLFRSGRL
jgi:hypothetical protein